MWYNFTVCLKCGAYHKRWRRCARCRGKGEAEAMVKEKGRRTPCARADT